LAVSAAALSKVFCFSPLQCSFRDHIVRLRSNSKGHLCFSSNEDNDNGIDIEKYLDQKFEAFIQSPRFEKMMDDRIKAALGSPKDLWKSPSSKAGESEYTDEDLIETRALMEKYGASGFSNIDKRLMSGYVPALKRKKALLKERLLVNHGVIDAEAERAATVLEKVAPLAEPALQGQALLQGRYRLLSAPRTLCPAYGPPGRRPLPGLLGAAFPALAPRINDAFNVDTEDGGDLNVQIECSSIEFEFPDLLFGKEEERVALEKAKQDAEQDFSSPPPIKIKVSRIFSGVDGLDGLHGELFMSGNFKTASDGKGFLGAFDNLSVVLDGTPAGGLKKQMKELGFKNILTVWNYSKKDPAFMQGRDLEIPFLDQDTIILKYDYTTDSRENMHLAVGEKENDD